MRTVRIISVILALATLCCCFIACDQEGGNVSLPEREFYDIKVSFQIKDANGKTFIEAIDYNYKGHETPTILNIISDYLYIEAEYVCKIDSTNTLTQIGSFRASKKNGEYWAFAEGINLSLDIIMSGNSFIEDQRMSDYIVEDGGAFTLVLVANEEE